MPRYKASSGKIRLEIKNLAVDFFIGQQNQLLVFDDGTTKLQVTVQLGGLICSDFYSYSASIPILEQCGSFQIHESKAISG